MARAGLLVAIGVLLCLCTCHAIEVRELTVQDEIQLARLSLYRAVIQQIAVYKSTQLAPGTVLPIQPTLPDYQDMEIVEVFLATLLSQGYKFNEITLPPGLNITTTSPKVLLVYQKSAVFVSPFIPPPGTTYTPYVLALDIVPSINSNALPQTIQSIPVTASPNAPITISFPVPKVPGTPTCTQFDAQGQPSDIGTNAGAAAVECSTQSLGDWTLTFVHGGLHPPPATVPPAVVPPTAVPPGTPSTPSPQIPAPSTPGSPETPASPGTTPPTPGENPPSPGSTTDKSTSSSGSGVNTTLAIALGVGIPVALLLILVAYFAIMRAQRAVIEYKVDQVEFKATNLETALISGNREPIAGAARTKAQLQDEFFTEGI